MATKRSTALHNCNRLVENIETKNIEQYARRRSNYLVFHGNLKDHSNISEKKDVHQTIRINGNKSKGLTIVVFF